MNKLLVIIPCYNESGSIIKVVESIKLDIPGADVLVVNDCSTDNSLELLNGNLINHIDLPINLGIGGAMQTGYLYAKNNGYDYAVQIDGDGQHNPAEVPKLLTELQKGDNDMIIGSRFLQKTQYKQTYFRKLGIDIFKVFTKYLIGYPISDATSGFRIVNKRVIAAYADYYPTDYPEPEVLVYLEKLGMKVKEIPVTMSHREHGKSSITPLKSAYYMMKVATSMVIMRLRSFK